MRCAALTMLLCLSILPCASAGTLVLRQDLDRYAGTGDAQIDREVPTRNRGTAPSMYLHYHEVPG